VGTALIYLVVMVLVAAVVFLLASAVFGRGEELAPLPPGASPTRLPAGDVTGDDVRALRFQQVLRGYKMTEVDWVLERMGTEVDRLRARVAELEGHPLETGHSNEHSNELGPDEAGRPDGGRHSTAEDTDALADQHAGASGEQRGDHE
jgi:DivIVA domain-containing protein